MNIAVFLWTLASAGCGSSDDPAPPGADAGLDAALPSDAGTAGDAGPALSRPRIDGLFDDWSDVDPAATDPAGDATGAFDVGTVQARSVGSEVFLRFDVGERRNLNAGDEADGTLRLEVWLGDGRHLTVDARDRSARVDGRRLEWGEIGYEAAPTHSNTEFEASLDLGGLGIGVGDTVTIDFSGSDELDAPIELTLRDEAAALERRSTARQEPTTVRIASLNTLESGLLTERYDAIVRMLQAAQADVICLQEDYDLPPEDLVPIFEEIAGDGSSWNVIKVRDNDVASRFPVTPIDGFHERYAAAAIDLGDAGTLVVVGVHLTCCGYDGSPDDVLRINEALGVVRTVETARSGGDPGLADAPVVVIGDWNLVGSREPVEVVEDPERLGLTQWLVPDLVGEHVMTWGSSASEFPPGILDLVLHSPEGLTRRNGFVLDESRLDDAERQALGLQAGDGFATDHRLIVADFELTSSAP